MAASKKRRIIWALVAACVLAGLVLVLLRPVQTFRGAGRFALSLLGVDERTLATGPYTIHFFEAGRKDEPAVILLHGVGSNAMYAWGRLLPDLGRSMHVLAPDLLFGNVMGIDPDGYTLSRDAQMVLSLMDAKGIERADLVGLSLGGWLALELAVTHPERVGRLALIASPGISEHAPRLGEIFAEFESDLAGFYQRIFHDPPPLPGFVLDLLQEQADARASRLKRLLDSLDSRQSTFDGELAHLDAPALVVWGENDRIMDPAMGRALARLLPEARLVVLSRCGHAVVWDRPCALARELRAFLLPQGPPGRPRPLSRDNTAPNT